MKKWTKSELLATAEKINILNAELNTCFQGYSLILPEKYHRLLAELNSEPYMGLYKIAGTDSLNMIKAGCHDSCEQAIIFLDADPYFFRSGYMKKKLCTALKQSKKLSSGQERALRRIIIQCVFSRFLGDEFREFTQLARKLYTPDFLAGAEKIETGGNPYAKYRRALLIYQLRESAK